MSGGVNPIEKNMFKLDHFQLVEAFFKTKNQTVWKHPGSLTLKLSLRFETPKGPKGLPKMNGWVIPLRMNGWDPRSLSFWAFWSVDLPGWLGL